ncbi:MAG TPA: YraN family protein [Candidatus Saccharimonadales bacterium]
MSTTATGRAAEQAAAQYLERCGYRVLEHNWRTRWCEIDLVAEKTGSLHFVEVKYRANAAQGSGLDYITPKKLRQMRFAADIYAADRHWQGGINIAAIEMCAPDYAVGEFIESIAAD